MFLSFNQRTHIPRFPAKKLLSYNVTMFIDEAEVTIQGGDGGPGKIAFYPNKNGPCGGNGGKGGNVFAVFDSNIPDLKKFTEVNTYKAQDGQQGGFNKSKGSSGKDIYIRVPLNTIFTDLSTGEELVIADKSEKFLLCSGGEGGMGNDSFKTATNRTPRKATQGQIGEEKKIKLILKLIADLGLIGLPNAGKSSLLNTLTNAHVKTADYPFTTLEPNLGVFEHRILADIPGLIEGASKGKGLGIKFLKHIEKVSLLLHCISVESENIDNDYSVVIEEIGKYNPAILTKKSIILLTKTDLVSPEVAADKQKKLKKFKKMVLPVSLYNQDSLISLKKLLLTYN